ncbi:MAG TPA: glycoside hydrolase family 16 protein, partial [Chitinophagaceae bacterium]|nr:glycoside hydrolase family 16 protein [Chitinophagaceae bacterium]
MKLILSRKPALACLLFGLALASCKKERSSAVIHEPSLPKQESVAAAAAATYQLVWSDEFNGTSVSTSNWNFETGAGGWGNNEKQYYRSQNATVSGGNLIITAKKESFGGASYT